jgi:hypothetical protein
LKDFSFLISSKRDYDTHARKTVDSIFELKTDYSFEVIVCHPDEIKDDRIKWIKDDKLIGANYSFHLALLNSCGRYVSICVDDCAVRGDIFGSINFLESELFKDRKFKITTLSAMPFYGFTNEVTLFEGKPKHKDVLVAMDCYLIPPRFNVMCFPILSRETIEKELGGFIFHPRIKSGHDWWLGAFLHMNDEPGIQYNNAKFFSLGSSNSLKFDPILREPCAKFLGESYVNTYRLIKNYKKGMAYVYDNDDDFLTESTIYSHVYKIPYTYNHNRESAPAKPIVRVWVF